VEADFATSTLDSYSAQTGKTITINVNDLTQLEVDSIYEAQGTTASTRFAAPEELKIDPAQLGVASAFLRNDLSYATNFFKLPPTINFISHPITSKSPYFNLLSNTTLSTSATTPVNCNIDIKLSLNLAYTSRWTFNTTNQSISSLTSITDPISTYTSQKQDFTLIPATTDAFLAYKNVNNLIWSVATTINNKGTNLSYTKLLPLFYNGTPGYRNNGNDAIYETSRLAQFKRGKTIIGYGLGQILSYTPNSPGLNQTTIGLNYYLMEKGETLPRWECNTFVIDGSRGPFFFGNQQQFGSTLSDSYRALYPSTGLGTEGPYAYWQVKAPAAVTIDLSNTSISDTYGFFAFATPLTLMRTVTELLQGTPKGKKLGPYTFNEYGVSAVSPFSLPPDLTFPFPDDYTAFVNGNFQPLNLRSWTNTPVFLAKPTNHGFSQLGHTLLYDWFLLKPPPFVITRTSISGIVCDPPGTDFKFVKGPSLVPTASSANFTLPLKFNGHTATAAETHIYVGGDGFRSELTFDFGLGCSGSAVW